MTKSRAKGIFCLEGDWTPDLRRPTTVGPVLELLSNSNVPPVPYIRRDIGTRAEFRHYLEKWTQRRYDDFPILYLGFHGAPGALQIGDGRSKLVDLNWLADVLEGKCKKRIILFGSCGTMAVHPSQWRRFLLRTFALAACGYRADVDWVLSTAFEMILLSGLQRNALTRAGMAAVRRRVERQASRLARDLKFKMVIAPK